MTPIVVRCPSCKKRFKIKNRKLVGRKLLCSNCQTAFRVQAPAAAKAVARKSKDEVADVRVDEAGDDSFEDDFAAPPPRPTRRRPSKNKRRPEDRERGSRAEGRKRVRDEDKSETNRKMAAIVVGCSVLGMLLVGGLVFALSGLVTGGSVEVPTEFVGYVPEERSFQCEYPSGWDARGGGGSGGKPAWATFEKGSVYISIRDSHSGQAIGDMARAGNNAAIQAGLDPEPPVVEIHDLKKESVAGNMNDYEEGPAQVINCGFGEGRYSEFTARTTFGGKLRGLRVTFLSTRNQLNVLCKSPEAQFEALKPSFTRVIESIKAGGGHKRK